MAELGNATSLGEPNGTLLGVWSFSRSECITWMIVLCTLSVSIVTLNGLSIIVFLRERRLRKRHMYLVISLTVADLLAGAFSPFFMFYSLTTPCRKLEIFPIGNFATILAGLAAFFFLSSLANLPAISLERLHATFRPFKHRLMKKRTFGAAVVAVWFTEVILVVVDLLLFSHGVQTFSLFCVCVLSIPVFVAVSIAAKIDCATHPRRHGGVNKERRLTKTLFIVTSVSLILSLQYNIFGFVAGRVETHSSRTQVRLYLVSLCLVYLNSFVNPIFYAFRMPEFKRALISVLMCRPLSARHVQEFPLNNVMPCN